MNSPTPTRKAVFLDRDGTIIKDANYLSDPANVVLLPNVAQALTLLHDAGFLLFLFTNQSGVGRGLFPIETVYRCNDRMLELLGLPRPVFEDICIAPESPSVPSIYRKPNPRFINECVTKYGLNRSLSWMVGDKLSDAETGWNACIMSALIGNNHVHTKTGTPFYESLFAFAQAATSKPD